MTAPAAPIPTMTTLTEADPASPSRTWQTLIERVREAGGYTTRAQAERVTRTVLSALGTHVTGDERVALARTLPEEAARVIAAQIPVVRPLTAREFVESVASRLDNSTPATARWDTGTVLTVLADLLPPPVLTDVLTQLPPGYALLFGRAELTGPRPPAPRRG